ncbi:hypothetical protein PRZ03_17850 [Paucibacter sp. hw8]|uniref:Uncharacterized protein n=2 Tax=Roseateles albus TaxID=2987525 RepID=A0ABT5KIV8_9BURK|nr:hypothetical protein [Roseateles albus]
MQSTNFDKLQSRLCTPDWILPGIKEPFMDRRRLKPQLNLASYTAQKTAYDPHRKVFAQASPNVGADTECVRSPFLIS